MYFSHALIVMPPPSWVNVAHRHGTKVLGTLITENDEGLVQCEDLFGTADVAVQVCVSLRKSFFFF